MADEAVSVQEVLKGIIGQPTGKSKVVVERGTVMHFADSVLSSSPIYHDPEAARAAGFDDIPAPPTWPFAMEFSGKFAELQPSAVPTSNPMAAAMAPLMAKGGLILHGEQEFVYHRPVQVGDVLEGDGKIAGRVPEGVRRPDDVVHRERDRLDGREDGRAGGDGALEHHPPRLRSARDARQSTATQGKERARHG